MGTFQDKNEKKNGPLEIDKLKKNYPVPCITDLQDMLFFRFSEFIYRHFCPFFAQLVIAVIDLAQ